MYSDMQSVSFTDPSLDKNDVNWSEKIRSQEWTWSDVARLHISRDIPEITYGTKV
ncbi:hypothetical protein T4C_2431 [Trichinella pseudospiralis]|uniref:Uncharacterized protein n=1 Tax=Trichinella pseudospiralis TaxID=6337 RepID=A0A0V0YGK3_TRIPS|nr:hypothetical protein T4E_9012 [Trichinella pseudospiralis]KRZ43498.1 hypothetical protein T4C_2431 [Trichinella pseudospiralis]